ncbi:hypothetical protein JD969_11025 [Planctomycetota bacterium]|nr:hypothetical protein JD969_11025 [Planctomycetota bacterium]
MIAYIYIVFVGLLAVGGVAVAVKALFGKQIDDHGYCWSCGYDLTGKDLVKGSEEAEEIVKGLMGRACPECGDVFEDGSGLQVGKRAHRRGLWVLSIVMFLPMGVMFSDTDWQQLMPNRVLVWEMKSPEMIYNYDRAIGELEARVVGGGVSDAMMEELVEYVLEVCEDGRMYNSRWGTLMIDLYEAGGMTNQQIERWIEVLAKGWAFNVPERVGMSEIDEAMVGFEFHAGENGRGWWHSIMDVKMRREWEVKLLKVRLGERVVKEGDISWSRLMMKAESGVIANHLLFRNTGDDVVEMMAEKGNGEFELWLTFEVELFCDKPGESYKHVVEVKAGDVVFYDDEMDEE